ncbi:Nucleotide exchange factor SIL1 [Lucilia cuprina]|uniref:Nucleotide exchange factor SIL1 n=2 Tax=Lucilia cuprina TaxID=7375 RepID=A0A0L0C299_LUCCU|nr:nucleotide exchange factor Sil1 isoform X2 [Lucilia cuprina]KAI8129622.1 Nucleotide exchange factor SIL1 [Lucilia cuprina]KNC25559.1 Nucleotide exchange factor SIL1 [Lucilia cuprina]
MKYLVILLIICLLPQGWAKESKENKTFVATKEWQEIPEGQGVPAGLHIRINLETGKKEAKILEENDDSEDDRKQQHQQMDKNAALSVVAESSGEEDDKKSTKKQKKVKHLDEALQRIGIDYTPKEKVENIIREYRSYEELKKSFEGMRKTFKTDAEVITQLIEEFQTSTSSTTTDSKEAKARVKTQMQILESFNYLMSQFDNALVFVDKGGLDHVLLPILVNSTNSALKVESMRVLGAMSQNNPRVQIKVYERNVGSHLAQIIMTSTNTEELSAALYAFSALLRKFPLAQQRILSTSGTQALMSVLNRDSELKIKVKAVVIIGDLLNERELALSESTATDDPLAAAQYAEINLSVWLMDQNFCEVLLNLLSESGIRFLEAPDLLEYVVNSLNVKEHLCYVNWSQDTRIMEIFIALKKRLLHSKDEYHLEVAQLLAQLLHKLYGDEYKIHDEL